jgi:hypothetical protein
LHETFKRGELCRVDPRVKGGEAQAGRWACERQQEGIRQRKIVGATSKDM